MESINRHSKACCNIPPIISQDYKIKGKYENIGGLKTYVTGSPTSKKAILVIYDIFGFFPQTIQGADILASSSSSSYQVFMPDLFEGQPADIEWYPPNTEEKQKLLGEWFAPRVPQVFCVPKIGGLVGGVEGLYGKKEWAALGFCWGGKVVAITSGADSLFKVSAQCHPGMINKADAEMITIPHLVLALKDEDPGQIKEFEEGLRGEKYVETLGA